MKLFRGIGAALILVVLIASIVLTLVAGAVRFMVTNPAYLKTFMPTGSYCREMRERLSDDLDHIALLYGLEEGSLSEVVTDDAIRSYTNTMIDALLQENATAPLQLPSFPEDGFRDYVRAHTAFSEQGVNDFAEDCAQAVTEDLAAINTTLIIEPFLAFRENTFTKASLILFIAGLMLVILMIVFLKLMYMGKSKRTGSVLVWGGSFAGVTVVFVPVMQFLLFDYIGRLNISISAFRTVLTGFLNTILYGWFIVLIVLEILTFILLLVAITRASGNRKKQKAR